MPSEIVTDKIENPLYLITDGGHLRRCGQLYRVIEQALDGAAGAVRYVQLREQKGESPASDSEVARLVEDLLPLCERFGARLLVNSRVDLAKRYGAHGVHLTQSSPSIQDARAALGGEVIIGYSTHSQSESKIIAESAVDYLLLAPIFAPVSKSSQTPPLGLEVLAQVTQTLPLPIFALGGVKPANAAHCRLAGANGIATVGAVLLSENPKRAAEEMVHSWNRTPELLSRGSCDY